MLEACADICTVEMLAGKQGKQNGQRAKDHLQRAVQPERADEHHGGEQSPHCQIRAHRNVIRRHKTEFWQTDQGHERQPEETVGNEGGGGKSVALFPFHDARDHLRGAAVANAHRQNHAVEFKVAGIVQVEQHGRHAKAEQPQRGRIGRCVLDLSNGWFAHVNFGLLLDWERASFNRYCASGKYIFHINIPSPPASPTV